MSVSKIFLIFLFSLSSLEATFVDNFSKPSIIHTGIFIPDTSLVNCRAGVVTDYLIKKKLHPNTSQEGTHSFWISNLGTMASLTFNIREWFEATGYLGSGYTHFHFTFEDMNFFGKKNGQLFWGLGGKLIIFEREGLCFGVDGKLIGLSSSIFFAEPLTPNHFSLFEWQVAAGLSQKFSFFIPYLGVTFTNAKVHIKPFPILGKSLFKLRHNELWGVVAGFTLSSGEYVSFDVEGRFVNETGIYASLDVRF